jgi:hypothetical protein
LGAVLMATAGIVAYKVLYKEKEGVVYKTKTTSE